MPLWVHDEGGRLRCFATSRLHLVIRSHHPPPAPYRPSPAKMPRTGRYPEQGDSYRPGGIGLSVLVVGTDCLAADLTADGLRKFVHEFDDARVLVGRSDLLHMILQFPDQLLPGPRPVFIPEDDRRFDHLPPDLVGNPRDGTFDDGRMGHQGALHLEGADPVARTLDHVVGTPHEPEISVLVAPCHVARIVHAVVPDLVHHPVVQVILLEKPQRLPPVGTDHDLPLFAVLGRTAVRRQEIDIVLGVGHAHAAGLGLHPRKGGEGQRRFGLPETLHQADAGQAFERVVNGTVERLARGRTVLQRRKVVFRKVFANQETVDRRRRTQRGYPVLPDLAQDVGRRKFLVVVNENVGPGQPLPVQLAPGGLRPSGVGNGEVQAALVEVVPEAPRADMPQRIGEIVGDYLNNYIFD